ncbi:MAG: ATP-dependent zinc protease [Nanoarchaeota archaeon]|nr:ATP-dependent zinc protease [Nanoarchaeota archaeon]
MEGRLIVGLIEEIVLEDGSKYLAKIDTGADSSSIDEELVKKFGDKKIISYKVIRSALGRHKRPIVKLDVVFQGIHFRENFTVSNRKSLKYKILIGKDILRKEGFLVDPRK